MTDTSQRALPGIAASHGIVVGTARVLDRSRLHIVPRRRVPTAEVAAEVARLRDAIERSREDIEGARAALGDLADADYQLVLDAHLLMHGDALLVDSAIEKIEAERLCAEWALMQTVESLSAQLGETGSAYFRDRAADITQVGKHILRCLTGSPSAFPALTEPMVIIADDLSPGEAARLADSPLLALVTELGSATSHTAIVARALGIPALVGVADATVLVGEGDTVVVDALRGRLILGSSKDEQDHAAQRSTRYLAFTAELSARATRAAATADGVPVVLSANLEIGTEAMAAAGPTSGGVGLYRTEFLFLGRDRAPTEEEQYTLYSQVLETMKPRPVTFRTFDLGADKLPADRRFVGGPNPALGLRGVRLLRTHPRLFKVQIRAILRAATIGQAKLMFPMVASVADMRSARALYEEVVAELEAAGTPFARVPVGAMVEVPAAALNADAIAGEVDFFSVGTNDLIQYTHAVDRTNPRVATLADPLDPAVLKLLDMTARASARAVIGLSLCGDMAADPHALPLLLGLGFRHLSMASSSIPLANAIAARVDAGVAAQASADALSLTDAGAVRELVRDRFAAALGEIWTEQDGD